MTCHFARLLDDGEPIVGLSGQLDSIKMSAQTLSHAIYELFRLDAEPEGDRGLTNRLILISNATRALSESCQNGLSQTHS